VNNIYVFVIAGRGYVGTAFYISSLVFFLRAFNFLREPLKTQYLIRIIPYQPEERPNKAFTQVLAFFLQNTKAAVTI
jgi:hypothetical protein